MRLLVPAVLSAKIFAADLELTVEIPRLNAGEYHRPYVAVWIEKPDQSHAANLAVWYDQQTSKAESGSTWLKDLRQWWRKSGREQKLPIDGVSGATRPPGAHAMTFRPKLAPGSYQLVVEAAREVGGRELVRIPFQLPAQQPATAKGQSELGQIKLTVKP